MLLTSILNILVMGLWASLLTTIALVVVAVAEKKPALSPINSISHIFFGSRAFLVRKPDPKYLISGLFLNMCALVGWAAIAEIVLRVFRIDPVNYWVSALVAMVITMVAYVTDFHIVPKRFTPGFEHIIGHRHLIQVYIVLGVALFTGTLFRHL